MQLSALTADFPAAHYWYAERGEREKEREEGVGLSLGRLAGAYSITAAGYLGSSVLPARCGERNHLRLIPNPARFFKKAQRQASKQAPHATSKHNKEKSETVYQISCVSSQWRKWMIA